MIQCKYLLPCGYCDKNERICHIREKEILDSCTEELSTCSHDYALLGETYETDYAGNIRTITYHYKCSKCGALDFRYEVD